MKAAVPELDAFLLDLRELAELEGEPGLGDAQSDIQPDDITELGLVCASESLQPLAPSPALRAQLLADIPTTGRFWRFAAQVAEILDIGLEQAKQMLDRLDDPSVWSPELPGISFFWVDGGPRVAQAIRGFVRIAAGTDFPDHEHLGDETVLIMQGSMIDLQRGLSFHPGDVDRMPSGSSHAFHVPEDGPGLLKLSVVQTGLRALGLTYLPR